MTGGETPCISFPFAYWLARYVPKRLQRAIKIYCVEHDRPMAAVMTEAFREYLAQRPRPRTSRRPC